MTKSEEEVELQTPAITRYGCEEKQPKRFNPPEFHSYFALFSTKYDPRIVKEEIDSTKGELWKKAMEEEMEPLRKNETWDMLKSLKLD